MFIGRRLVERAAGVAYFDRPSFDDLDRRPECLRLVAAQRVVGLIAAPNALALELFGEAIAKIASNFDNLQLSKLPMHLFRERISLPTDAGSDEKHALEDLRPP